MTCLVVAVTVGRYTVGVRPTARVDVPGVTVMDRPTLDEIFLAEAALWATRSTCSRRKVGAVVAKDGHTISAGYNGVPSGDKHCVDGGCPRGKMSFDECLPFSDYNQFPCNAAHAEFNALIRAGYDRAKGATIYITCAPCLQCEIQIRTAGIVKAVWPGLFPGDAFHVREYR